jgi:hypothetical protein
VSENLKNGLFRGEFFFSRKKKSPLRRAVSARAESYKKVRKQIYKKMFLLTHVFREPGSGIRDGKKSGSRIRDPG